MESKFQFSFSYDDFIEECFNCDEHYAIFLIKNLHLFIFNRILPDHLIKSDAKYSELVKTQMLLKKVEPYVKLATTCENSQIKNYLINFYKSRFGYSVPTLLSLKKIQKFVNEDCVLEVCAGKCYWSALMESVNINIITTSIIDDWYSAEDMMNTWTQCELIDCVDAIKKYKPKILFLSWGYNVLEKCMDAFSLNGGEKIIIIHKGNFDCTDCLYEDNNCVGVRVYQCSESTNNNVIYPYRLIKSHKGSSIPITYKPENISFYERIR